MLMTATSVVPPPMSMIIEPTGSSMRIPAPIAPAIGSSMRSALRAPISWTACTTARFSTSVMPEGMQTMMVGRRKRAGPVSTLLMKALSIFSVRV
jgi:hypothetical protein